MNTTRPSVTLKVDGMTCQNCVKHVTDELKANSDVAEVMVHLRSGETSDVVVTQNDPIDDDTFRAAIEEAGYELVGVDRK